jgi:RHS repeat-associated protein
VYDGAGNVSALVSATNGAVTATYEYGPFGELTRATGPTSKLNEVMYQSQICDWESGKYYWKYRYYDTSTGRWLNHDPIGESGGANLYAFVGNNPDNVIDATGLNGYPPNFIGPLQPGDVRGPFLPNPNQKPPNWNPSWPTGSDGRGEYTEDPNTGTRYYPHDEDPRHWPHYDDSKGKSYPEKCVKPRPGQKRKPFGDQSPTDPWPQPTQSFWHYVHPIDSWTVNPFGLASGLGATATAGAVVATSEGTVSTPWWLLIFGW